MEIVAVLVTAGVGIFIVLAMSIEIIRTKKTQKWPTVEGVIIQSTVESGWKKMGGNKRIMIWEPKVVYAYEIEGRKYKGDRIELYPANTAGSSRETAEKYPLEKHLPVHYNPKKPSDSTLEMNVKIPKMIFMSLLATLLLGFAVLMAVNVISL